MSQLIIDGKVFNYPDPGTEAGLWGQDATDWAKAVTEAINNSGFVGAITASSIDVLTNKTINANDNTILNLTNASISSSAEIEVNKLAPLTANKALQSNSITGLIEASSVTNTELGYLSGVTSAIQTQITNILNSLLPVASVLPYAGATAPTGYFLCNGAVVNRITYANLFAVIGTTYGSGDGLTTFTLPDLRGRLPVGNGAGSFTSLGQTLGEETHSLSIAELASHTHTQQAHTHTQDAHTHTQNAHNHGITDPGHFHGAYNSVGGTATHGTQIGFAQIGGVGQGDELLVADLTDSKTTGITINNATATNQNTTATNQNTTAINNSTGSGTAHNNIQPSLTMNYIIKY